jgi:hypothetical protein
LMFNSSAILGRRAIFGANTWDAISRPLNFKEFGQNGPLIEDPDKNCQ